MNANLTPEDVALKLNVDPKTVERWITTGRTPYPKHRHKLAVMLHKSETYLWPDAISRDQAAKVSESEIVNTYPHRNLVPPDLWDRLLDQSRHTIDILVYVGMFLTEKPNLPMILQKKAQRGTRVRFLFGDRNSAAVIQRSTDEGIGQTPSQPK